MIGILDRVSTPQEDSPLDFSTKNLSTSLGTELSPHQQQHQQLSTLSSNKGGRATRPFKAYPKDPMSFPTVGLFGLPVGPSNPSGTETILHQQSYQAYAEFRKQMLASSQLSRNRRGGQRSGNQGSQSDSSNEGLSFGLISVDSGMNLDEISDDGDCGKSRNGNNGKSDQQMKDEAYWERRRKNNEAAKRSRDARRAKEDEIAIRAAFLEQENLKLRFELCALKSETAKLRCMLYNT